MKNIKNVENVAESHSDLLTRTLLDKLAKMTPQQLQEEGIVMSPEFIENLPQAEMKYLLDNFIPQEELQKIDNIQKSMTSLDCEDCCEFCKKPKRTPGEICCTSKEIQVYLEKCEDLKLLKRFSSNALQEANAANVQSSLEDIKRIAKEERDIQERKSKASLDKFESQKDKCEMAKSEKFKAVNFDKNRGTLLRIQQKMENLKKFCPELYNSEESVISMWASSPTYFANEETREEIEEEN